ncbi:uncharacterized protein V1516DRAFT_665130 [Lipomyces oligophaga]|uniref:uncharacterized protein n=1 Tax=Lipomyces oligophaga TaxID=45792 RepID=UPI0034CECB6D
MASSESTYDQESTEFLRHLEALKTQADTERAKARSRNLEQEIEEARRQRQARKIARSRSTSPAKSTPFRTPTKDTRQPIATASTIKSPSQPLLQSPCENEVSTPKKLESVQSGPRTPTSNVGVIASRFNSGATAKLGTTPKLALEHSPVLSPTNANRPARSDFPSEIFSINSVNYTPKFKHSPSTKVAAQELAMQTAALKFSETAKESPSDIDGITTTNQSSLSSPKNISQLRSDESENSPKTKSAGRIPLRSVQQARLDAERSNSPTSTLGSPPSKILLQQGMVKSPTTGITRAMSRLDLSSHRRERSGGYSPVESSNHAVAMALSEVSDVREEERLSKFMRSPLASQRHSASTMNVRSAPSSPAREIHNAYSPIFPSPSVAQALSRSPSASPDRPFGGQKPSPFRSGRYSGIGTFSSSDFYANNGFSPAEFERGAYIAQGSHRRSNSMLSNTSQKAVETEDSPNSPQAYTLTRSPSPSKVGFVQSAMLKKDGSPLSKRLSIANLRPAPAILESTQAKAIMEEEDLQDRESSDMKSPRSEIRLANERIISEPIPEDEPESSTVYPAASHVEPQQKPVEGLVHSPSPRRSHLLLQRAGSHLLPRSPSTLHLVRVSEEQDILDTSENPKDSKQSTPVRTALLDLDTEVSEARRVPESQSKVGTPKLRRANAQYSSNEGIAQLRQSSGSGHSLTRAHNKENEGLDMASPGRNHVEKTSQTGCVQTPSPSLRNRNSILGLSRSGSLSPGKWVSPSHNGSKGNSWLDNALGTNLGERSPRY